MSNFSLDLSSFLQEFPKVCYEKIPSATQKGLFNAASELKLDSDHVEPKTPVKEGHLKGSWEAHVEFLGGKTMEWTLVVGFNIKYASYVHEMAKKHAWTEPGSGPKFLESKLYMFKDKYLTIVAETVKRGG